jgi:Carboxypeptidase regulatory-like domain
MRVTIGHAAAFAALLATGALVPGAANAEGPATLHGQVYSCSDNTPIASAHVTLRGIDDGTLREITTGPDGRFVRVGLMPGRYLIVASPGYRSRVDAASRMALLDTDDNLSVRIGTNVYKAVLERRGRKLLPRDPSAPDPYERAVPACDSPLVPLASSTSNRYVIH